MPEILEFNPSETIRSPVKRIQFLPLGQAAQIVGITPKSLRKWCNAHDIPVIPDPKRSDHRRYDIDAILKKRRGAKMENSIPNNAKLRTISIHELVDKERLDTKKIIREGVKRIPTGELAYEETFVRDLAVSRDKFKDVARDEEFDLYRAVLPTRKVVWGQIATIAELRKHDGVT